MDLAKIRQKARQDQESRASEEIPPCVTDVPEPGPVDQGVTLQERATVDSSLERLLPIADPISFPAAPLDGSHMPAIGRAHLRAPLEVILAGRDAAGCDENLPLVSEEHSHKVVDDYQEYLCFRVSDEIYGINIMDIKEIIKPREVTEVPRSPSFVSGIISLRGIIIPIIDMLDRLGLQREKVTGRERVIVVRNGDVFSGLLVDEIIQVVHIANDCLEAAPAVLEGIDRDFVSGIGRADGRMIILLNLETIADIHLY